jgi:dihydrodipicolinate synthase/N-acetylneuraminate lyase
MSTSQRKRVAEVVVSEVRNKVPVIIQVGAVDPQVSLELAKHAEKVGATAIASLTPFYYQPGEKAIIEYFKNLSDATALPILVYNIPRHTGNNVDVHLLMKLIQIKHIVGIKDSSRDFSQLLDFLVAVPNGFNVINGTDSFLFSAFCAGVKCGVSATASACPELFVQLYDVYRAGSLNEGKGLQIRIHALRSILDRPPLAPIYEALKMRGVECGTVKSPLRSMTDEEIKEFRAAFARQMPAIVKA